MITLAAVTVGLLTMAAAAQTPPAQKDRAPSGPTISVVTKQREVKPGELITLDVLVSNVSNLGSYQVKVQATGGERSGAVLEKLFIDTARSDYVFGTRQVLKAVAAGTGEMGAMLFPGSVNVTRPAYLGTYKFRVSADAKGSFSFNVNTAPEFSFLLNSGGIVIPFRPGKGVPVSVAAAAPERIDAKVK